MVCLVRPWSLDDFHILKVLGQGSFGKVFLGEHKSTKVKYAVKVLSKFRVFSDDDVLATMSERRVLTLGAQCPFLANMVAGFQVSYAVHFFRCLLQRPVLALTVLQWAHTIHATSLTSSSSILIVVHSNVCL